MFSQIGAKINMRFAFVKCALALGVASLASRLSFRLSALQHARFSARGNIWDESGRGFPRGLGCRPLAGIKLDLTWNGCGCLFCPWKMYCAPIPAHYLREMLGLENKLEIKPYNLFCFIFFLSSKSQVFLIFLDRKCQRSLSCLMTLKYDSSFSVRLSLRLSKIWRGELRHDSS